MDYNSRRDLVVSISEIFDMQIPFDKQINERFKGALPAMATSLSVNYVRKTAGGLKCVDPSNVVYIDNLVEALAYVCSLFVEKPEHIPMLLGLIHGRMASRLQTFVSSKFPDLREAMFKELQQTLADPDECMRRKTEFLDHFNSQLYGMSGSFEDKKPKKRAKKEEAKCE